MKYGPAILSAILYSENTKRNVRLLLKFIVAMAVMVTFYSGAFHGLMALEGRSYSWITGFYWTLTVMTTLGFGDITFSFGSWPRPFLSWFLFPALSFFSHCFPLPSSSFSTRPGSRPRQETVRPVNCRRKPGVTLSSPAYNAVTSALIDKLKDYQEAYVLIEEDYTRALDFHDAGIRVAVGNIDDPADLSKNVRRKRCPRCCRQYR